MYGRPSVLPQVRLPRKPSPPGGSDPDCPPRGLSLDGEGTPNDRLSLQPEAKPASGGRRSGGGRVWTGELRPAERSPSERDLRKIARHELGGDSRPTRDRVYSSDENPSVIGPANR